jgi:hypothetical protein
MRKLRDPETGEVVHASTATAERLCGEGWDDLAAPSPLVDEPEGKRPSRSAKRSAKKDDE